MKRWQKIYKAIKKGCKDLASKRLVITTEGLQIGNGRDVWGMLLVQWIGFIFFEKLNTNEIPFKVFWQLMEIHEETNPQE